MNEIPETERMVLDFDKWHAAQPDVEREQLEGYLQNSQDRERAKRDIASRLVVSESSGIAPDVVDADWELNRGGFAADRKWEGAGVDDDSFFEKLKSESQFRRDERQLTFGPDDEKAPDAADKRKLSLVSQVEEAAYRGEPMHEAFAAWQGSSIVNKGWRADRTSVHETVAKEVYEKMSAAVAKVRPVVDEAFGEIARAREGVTLGDNGGDASPFALFRGMSEDEERIAMRMMLDRARKPAEKGRDGVTLESPKDRTDAFMEALGRGFENLGVGFDDKNAAALRRAKFSEGSQVSGDTLAEHLNSQGIKSDVFEVFDNRNYRTLSAEEAETWNREAAKWAGDLDLKSRLVKLGQELIDPSAKNEGGAIFNKMVLPVADSAAVITSMSIPGFGLAGFTMRANQYSGEQYRQLRDAGMASDEADLVSGVSGLAQSAADIAGFAVLKGLPVVKNTLAKFALGASPVKRFAANFTTTTVAETSIELTQDHIIPALAQDILASDPAFDVKWADVWSDVAKTSWDTALGMVLLSGAGAVHQTLSDSRFTRELASSKAAMTLSGYTDAQIETIQNADASEQGRLLAELRPAKAPEGAEKAALVERFQKAAKEELEVFNSRSAADVGDASEALDYAVRVTRKGDGWNVTTADGQNIIVDTAEAARRIRDELKQASTVREAEAIVALIDEWHGKADANTQRETTLTGEVAKSDGRSIEYFRDGEKVREITDARSLETIRKQATIDSQHTGNEEINVIVNGVNSHQFVTRVADGARVLIQRIELNKSASSYITFVHESVESNWRSGVDSGKFSHDEATRAIASIASGFAPESAPDAETKALFERVQRVARGEANETELRETISELTVSDYIGKRKDGGSAKAGAVSAAISDAIRALQNPADVKALGKLKAFMLSVKHYFRAVFATVKAIRNAKRKDGKLAEDWENFMNKLVGVDEQVAHDTAVAAAIESELRYDEDGNPDWTASVSKVTTAQDEEYMAAAERGDTATAQRMVDAAAKASGYSRLLWHGTNETIYEEGKSTPGDRQAFSELQSYAEKLGVKSPLDLASLVERWVSMGMNEEYGVSSADAKLFRDLATRAQSGTREKGKNRIGFNEFNAPQGELETGIHLGTQGQASGFGDAFPFYVRIKNPIRLPDLGTWNYQSVLREVRKAGVKINDAEHEKIWNATDNNAALRGLLKSKGIDGIVYKNEAEGHGDSFIALDPSQIKSADPTTRDEAGNIVPLSQRFDSSKDDIRFSLSAGAMLEAVMKRVDADLARDPAARRRVQKKANDALQKLQFNWETERMTWKGDKIKPVSEPRTPESLTKEQAFREAMRREELESEVYGVYGDVLDNEAMAQMWGSGPVMEALSRPGSRLHGWLMSKSAALKSNKFNQNKQGDYDGANGIPRVVFGGDTMPDQMAQQLFDDGKLKEPTADALWDAIRSELKNAERWKGFLATAKADLKLARNKAHEEAAEWRRERDEEQAEDWSPKNRLLRYLRTLDAILSALPPEVRGKVGGFVRIASLSTDKARMSEIEKRIKKIDVLLEKHLRKESIEAFDALMKRAAPSTGPGESPGGKITVEGHRVFAAVESVWQLSEDEVSDLSAALEKQIDEKLSKGEDVLDLLERQQIVDMFGAFEKKDAASMDAAVTWLQGVFDKGRNAWRMIEEQRLAEIKELVKATVKAIGSASLSGTLAKQRLEKTMSSTAKTFALNLLSFVQVLENIVGKDHVLVKRWNGEMRRATAQKTDGILAANGRLETAAKAAFGDVGKLEMSQILWDMDNVQSVTIPKVEGSGTEKLTVPITVIAKWKDGTTNPADLGYSQAEAADLIAQLADPANAKKENLTTDRTNPGNVDPAKLTKFQAIALTMMAKMEQYAPNLAKHGYTAAAIKAAEDGLSDADKAIRTHFWKEYADGYFPMAKIFRDMHGIDLPQNAFYSPASFMHAGESKAMDPFGGGLSAEGGFRNGFLKTRKNHESAPVIKSALQTFVGHSAQTEHWKAFAPVARELKAVFGSVAVKDSILSKRGDGVLRLAQGWVSAIERNGVEQAPAADDKFWRFLAKSQAQLQLGWKVGTTLKQTMAAISSAARLPSGVWMRGFARVIGGKVDVKAIRESAMIQRRIDSGFSPEVRNAMHTLFSGRPSGFSDFVQRGMQNHAIVDGWATAVGAAIAYDHHFNEGVKAGLSEESARAQALVETEDVIGRTAQPTEMMDRSLLELGMSPQARMMFMFASNQRKDTALLLSAYSQWKRKEITGKQFVHVLGVAWLATGLGSALIGAAWRDRTDDDDDEWLDWEHWNPIDIARSVAFGPLGGVPLANLFASAAQGFGPPDIVQPVVRATGAAVSIYDEITAEDDSKEEPEPIEKTTKRVTDIMRGAAAIIPRAEALGSAANIVQQAFGLVDSLAPDTESEMEKKEKAATRKAKKDAANN